MAKIINAYTTAKAIVSARKLWEAHPEGYNLDTALLRALAREGRRDVATTIQALKSQLGRMSDVTLPIKSDSYAEDVTNAARYDEYITIRKALDILA